MKMTFRWFGEGDDNVTLQQIRQIPGMTGVVGFLGDIPAGEVWPLERLRAYKQHIAEAGLELEVIESVNVHEDIKLGLPSRDKYIENYITTIGHLGQCGIKVLCYNFMPVFDWLRTELAHVLDDGSTVLYYDNDKLLGMNPIQLVEQTAKDSNGFTLPGWEPARLKELQKVLDLYKNVDDNQLRANYKYFLEAIIPTCAQYDVRMAAHPDDPAWNVFGIPRIAHSQADYDKVINLVDSPYNGITLCTGSLGSEPANDLPSVIRHFCSKDRVSFAHVRNVKYLGEKKFREASHLSCDGSLDMFEIMKAFYESGFDGYMRPDHGRMIWGEVGRPGYGLYDRALGATYLNGLWEAISKTCKR